MNPNKMSEKIKKKPREKRLMVIRRPTLTMRHPDFPFSNFFSFSLKNN
jgi:hypothetical protein